MRVRLVHINQRHLQTPARIVLLADMVTLPEPFLNHWDVLLPVRLVRTMPVQVFQSVLRVHLARTWQGSVLPRVVLVLLVIIQHRLLPLCVYLVLRVSTALWRDRL